MEKQRGTVVAVVAALVVAVISLGVAFAAFSTTLTINGTATVEATTWDIYFSNSSSADSKPGSFPTAISDISESNSLYPSGETATGTGNITAATEITWAATFKTAGDKVVYKVYVRNDGDFDAEVSSTGTGGIEQVGATNFTCTDESSNPETSVCAHIHYGLYQDAAGNTPVASGLALSHNSYDEYYIIAWLDESYGGTGNSLATSDVTTALITTTVAYGQSGSAN